MSHPRHPPVETTTWAVALTVMFVYLAATTPADAQEDTSQIRIAPVTERGSRRAFLREIHRSLKAYDERLTGLAGRLLVGSESSPDRGMVLNLEVTAKTAEAGYKNAQLTREIAEIAVKEYREGIYVQDLLTVEGEIQPARSDLERARDMVQFTQRDADRLWAQLLAEGRSLRLESLELRKKALVEYAGPRRLKELEGEVAKARADERVKEAEWQTAHRQVEKARKASGAPVRRPGLDHGHRVAVAMTRAIELEGRLQSRLEEFAREAKSGEKVQKEIRTLTNELGTLIDEAEAEAAASDLDAVRRWIRGAGRSD